MARDFAWRDLFKLPRLRDQKIYFDTTLELTYQPGLFSSVVLSLISPSTGFCTSIQPLDNPEGCYLGQIHNLSGEDSARVSFLAPRSQLDQPGMSALLQHLCQQAGEQGVLQVLAEAEQNSPAENLLYGVGFKPYADQQIWLLPEIFPRERAFPAWIPITRRHEQEVRSLYQRVIPSTVKHVEPPPLAREMQGLIAWQSGRIVGYVRTHFGPSAVLMDAVLDPSSGNLQDQILGIRENLPYHRTRKIYFRVRGYQKRLSSALEALGARPVRNQTAAVKKLTASYKAPQKVNYRSFENQPDVTSPVSQTKLDK
jgi:hypothetical protein